MAERSVTRADLMGGFRALGLGPGDVVFVHSSLSSFGYVEGGAETVVDAFLEVLGPDGTLVVPTFGRYFMDGPDPVWDRERSPSRMGRVSESVRTWPGARRSPHAIHPVSAIGRLAEDFTRSDHETDFSPDSPFARLLEFDARVVLLGVTYRVCTLIHLIEEQEEIPYRRWVNRSGTVIDGGVARRRVLRFLERYPGVRNDFMPLGALLERENRVRIGRVGASEIRCFCARDLCEVGFREVRRDPFFLVSAATRAEAEKYAARSGGC